MKGIMAVSVVVLGVAGSILAATKPADVPKGYVYMTSSDVTTSGKEKSSWNQQGNWSSGGWVNGALNTQTNFYVPKSYYLYLRQKVNGESKVWAGGPMMFGGYLNIYNSTEGASKLPTFSDVTFNDSSYIKGTYRYAGLRNSHVKVLATREHPFYVYIAKANTSYAGEIHFSGTTFAGDENAGMRCYGATTVTQPTTVTLYEGNFTNYFGCFTIKNEPTSAVLTPADGVFTFAGDVVVQSNAVMKGATSGSACEIVYARSLTLEDGGTFRFYQDAGAVQPVLRLSKGLSLGEPQLFRISNFDRTDLKRAKAGSPAVNRHLLAHLDASAASTFVAPEGPISNLWLNADASRVMRDWRYETEPDGEGGANLYAVYPHDVVGTIKSDSAYADNDETHCAFGTSDPAVYWSNGVMPPADSTADYIMYYTAQIYRPANLPLATLTLTSSQKVFCHGRSPYICAKELNLVDAGDFYRYNGSGTKVMVISGGKLNLIGSESQSFYAGQEFGFRILSDITGEKTLQLTVNNASKVSEVSVLGDNSNYHGRLRLVSKAGDAPTALATYLADARNWGGAFTQDADVDSAVLFVRNPLVRVTNDVAFVGADVRNMSISNGVTFTVSAGKALTLDNKLTFTCDGTLTKNGGGTLSLAGTVAKKQGVQSAALAVSAGALAVGSTTAVEGLDVSFAEGTKLVVDKDCGFVNTTAANPLVIGTKSGKLTVEIDGFGERPENEDVEVKVLTLSAASAADIDTGSLVFVRTPTCRVVKCEKRTNGGNVDYVATVACKKGSLLLVR